MTDLTDWIGSERTVAETIDASPVAKLAVILGRDVPAVETGGTLPPMWHWLYFSEAAGAAEIGEDGHPRRGTFLPPVPLRRRMFAGSRTEFARPMVLGSSVRLRSVVTDVSEREGRSGPLVFVTIRDVYTGDRGPLLSEERDRVHPPATPLARVAGGGAPPPAPWSATASFDPVMLFRFSSVTFNGHRIHYDLPYARDVEGYPERVVHGPLLALLLLELAHSHGAEAPSRFGVRARAPVFCGEEAHLRGTPSPTGCRLAAYRTDGTAAVTASFDH
ncbi:MAG: MaoC family dehydratase N-terminal domain-containing protein [Acidimicrobiia bacterium]